MYVVTDIEVIMTQEHAAIVSLFTYYDSQADEHAQSRSLMMGDAGSTNV